MTLRFQAQILFSVTLLLSGLPAMAHNGHHHGTATHAAKEAEAKPDQKMIYRDIQAEYTKSIAPVFASKCANCHSANSQSPWYASFPGLHQWIEGDRTEAKTHLEISNGFPFAGHGEPVEDLKAIEESATSSSMPPKAYAFFHPSSRLTEMEKNRIVSWAGSAQQRLIGLNPQGKTK